MRKKGLLDPETGELVEVLMIGKDPAYRDKGFTKFFVSFLRDVVQDEEVTGKPIRLLLYIIDRLDWNSLEFSLFPEKVMIDLRIGKVTFYRWLNILLKKGYIQKIRPHYYRLKPYSVVRGNMKKLEEVDF